MMLHQTELHGATERFLVADRGLTAEQVKAEAVRLVKAHAARLGMDEYGAYVLSRAIANLPVAA